ncbi:MAG: succinate dehydrogenase assembly factor 2 [Acetobacteraceae bacterium]|nr:succinate dehydrogenase assembly factor 2 [Acetobacteraceae bacterium]
MTEPLSPRARRILFRATHRGTKEADLMIGGFVSRRIAAMDESELDALEAVLAHSDADLTDWLMRRKPVPPEAATPMLERMLDECGAAGGGVPEGARQGLGRA